MTKTTHWEVTRNGTLISEIKEEVRGMKLTYRIWVLNEVYLAETWQDDVRIAVAELMTD